MSRLTFKFSLDTSRIIDEVNSVIQDTYVLRDVHKLLAEMCKEYVPYDTGKLSDRGTYYTKDGVFYGVGIPYAHYVYEGIVFGPNVPYIDKKTGELKWTSPVSPKHPTGSMVYNQDWVDDGQGGAMPVPRSSPVHPKATRHWDEAMLAEKGDEFRERVEQIIQRRLRKLNG